MSDKLEIWTVYDHPDDFPDLFVARKYEIERGGKPVATDAVMKATSLKDLRMILETWQLVPVPRQENDDPKIVESWM